MNTSIFIVDEILLAVKLQNSQLRERLHYTLDLIPKRYGNIRAMMFYKQYFHLTFCVQPVFIQLPTTENRMISRNQYEFQMKWTLRGGCVSRRHLHVCKVSQAVQAAAELSNINQ